MIIRWPQVIDKYQLYFLKTISSWQFAYKWYSFYKQFFFIEYRYVCEKRASFKHCNEYHWTLHSKSNIDFFNARVTYKFKVLSFIQRKNHLNNLFTLKNILEKGLLCHFLSTVLIVLGLLCCKLLLFRIFLYT